jgi:hypothetical protein
MDLNRILDQFPLDEKLMSRVQEGFQADISSPESRVGVRPGIDPSSCCWLSAQTELPEYAFLAELALQLEPVICSEASSERTIAQQRRFLVPHRTRTNAHPLLARATMEDRRNQAQRHAAPV